jgi:two-component system, NarL family, response regulator DesR
MLRPAVEGGKVIRVVVAEDMRILRDTLVALLSLEGDIEVVAEVGDGGGIVPAAEAHHADVAIVDMTCLEWTDSPLRPA